MNHILPELFRLPSIRMAYFVELCLAEATGTLPDLIENILPHEVGMLDKVFAGLQELQSKLASPVHQQDIGAALEVFQSLLDPQRSLVSVGTSIQN